MAIIDIKRTVSLDGAIMPVALEGTLYGGENQAHRFIINATKDGAALNLSGTVTASFLRKADDAEVVLTGEIIGGGAAVTLAQSCYTQPGRFELTIFLTQNGSKTALYSCNGNVRNTSASEIVDPGHVVPDISDIVAEYARMQAASDAAEAAAESATEAATQNVHDAYANTDLNVTGRGYQTLRAVNFADNVIEGKYMRVVSSSDAAHATEDTASGWSIHEYQFGQRMVFRVEALSKNTAIGGDPSIMAARRTTTYPAEDGGQTVTEYFSIDLDRVGTTFIADAIRVNYNPSLGYSFNDISISYSENRNFEDIVVVGNHLSEADSIVAFGDSIFAGYNASNRGVITQLGELLSLPVTNLAISNATLSNAAPRPSTDAGSVVDQVAAYISDQANRGKKPLYLINGGTNDQYHHRLTDLGTYTDGVNGIYDTIYGATYKIINDLLGFGAQPWQIVVTTPIPKDIRNSTAEHVAEIDAQLTAIGAAMYDIGAAMMVNVINGYGGVFDNLTDANAMQLLMPDNTHPSQYGAKLYAERIFRLLGAANQREVTELKSAVEKNTDTSILPLTYTNKYCKIVSGKCVPGESTYETDSVGWKCYVVDCAAGDKFTINAQGGSQPRAYIFTKADGTTYTTNTDWTAEASALLNNYIITAPESATKLIVNDKETNGTQYKGVYLVHRVSALEEDFENALNLSTSGRTGLSANTDLNTLTAPGNYYAGTNATAQSSVTKQNDLRTTCILFVFSTYAENRIYQVCVETYSTANDIYKRYYNGTTWTEWNKIATLDNIPKALALTVSDRTGILSGTNYDQLMSPGNYYAVASTASSATKAPTTNAHVLYVLSTINDERIIQIAIESSLTPTMFIRYYNGTTWTEWRSFALSDDLRFDYTMSNVCPLHETDSVSTHGIDLSTDGNGNYKISGTASSAIAYDIYNASVLPDGIRPGQTYQLKLDNPSIGVRTRIYWLRGSDWDTSASVDTVKSTIFTVPSNATGMRLRFYIPSNYNVDAEITLSPKIYVSNSIGYVNAKVTSQRYPMMLTIIDDDGDANYYTDLKPLCEQKKISIASAVTTTRIGSADRWMTWDQIKDCYLSGCEILPHSYNHMTDDEIISQDISELQLEQWMRMNQYDLRSHGIKADLLVCNNNTANLVRYQKAARTVFKGAFHAAGYEINNPDTTDKYYIKRYNMGSAEISALSQMTDVLDTLISAGTGWMVWMIHTSARSTWSADYVTMLSDAIDYAMTHGIQVVTAEYGVRHYLGID